MSRKAKFTPEEKEQAVIDYLEGNKSRTQIYGELCISSRTIQDWALIYNKHGLAGFSRKIRNGSYSKEFKMKVVEEYIRGDGSSIDLGIKYDIPSGLLRSWIRMYNANRALKDYNPKQEVYMVFFVKYFSLKKASKFPVFIKGFSLLLAGNIYASLRISACSIR